MYSQFKSYTSGNNSLKCNIVKKNTCKNISLVRNKTVCHGVTCAHVNDIKINIS